VNLAFRTTGDREIALDVLQETFAYLWRKFPGFQLTAKFTTFLFPTVRHLAIAARRKRQRLQSPPQVASTAMSDPASSAADDPSQQAESPRDGLARVMAALPDTHREVVLLRFVDDLSLAEIAAAMDIPIGTVKSRLHHALRALREDEATKKYLEP
jgi:RNA polymerase sigma-70 factor (ECF subfamily)